jgi:hypothetical protein
MTNSIRTIIILQEREFSARDYARFGVEFLQRGGFRVEAWEISAVLHPDAASPDPSPTPLPGEFIPRRFTAKGEVLHAVRGLGPSTLVICMIGSSLSTLFVYRALSRKEIPYAVTVTNALPMPGRHTGNFRLDLPAKILFAILNTLLLRYYSLVGVRPASLCLVGGEGSLEVSPYPLDPVDGGTVLLPIHTLDYDSYLEVRDPPVPSDPALAVFIDGNDFYHLDLRFIGEPIPPWVDTYFSSLRRFFDKVEGILGVQVVIAVHPLARYTPEQGAHFGERELVQGRTVELVKRCRLVILHASTAVNLAVLFEKPIIFVTDQYYVRYPIGPYIEAISRELYLDGHSPPDWERELSVDKEAYGRYRRRFIKSDKSPDLPSWEILARYLKGEGASGGE